MIDIRKIQLNESIAVDTRVAVAMPPEFGAADTAAHVAGS